MFTSRRAFLSIMTATVAYAAVVNVTAAKGGGGGGGGHGGRGHDSALSSGTNQVPCPKSKKTTASNKTAASKTTGSKKTATTACK